MAALRRALAYDRAGIDNSGVLDWDGVTGRMLALGLASTAETGATPPAPARPHPTAQQRADA